MALVDVARRRLLAVRVVPKFTEVLSLPEKPGVIAVDMPIGLLDVAIRGGRECDRRARRFLGPGRSSSVFPPPVRAVLGAGTHAAACAANRASSPAGIGITLQTFGILGKLKEVDDAMTPALQGRVFEVHPEVSFQEMNGRPLRHGKKSREGRDERLRALSVAGFTAPATAIAGAARDDVLDAIAAAWSADRIHRGTAMRLGGQAFTDSRGLRMEISR